MNNDSTSVEHRDNVYLSGFIIVFMILSKKISIFQTWNQSSANVILHHILIYLHIKVFKIKISFDQMV